jgi:hypothetical protein
MREMPIRAHARDVFAGLIAGVVTIAYGLSFAALIFGPPLTAWLAYGIAATFLTSAIMPPSSPRAVRCLSRLQDPIPRLSRSRRRS